MSPVDTTKNSRSSAEVSMPLFPGSSVPVRVWNFPDCGVHINTTPVLRPAQTSWNVLPGSTRTVATSAPSLNAATLLAASWSGSNRHPVHDADGVEDWRVLFSGAHAYFHVGSFTEAARLVAAIADVAVPVFQVVGDAQRPGIGGAGIGNDDSAGKLLSGLLGAVVTAQRICAAVTLMRSPNSREDTEERPSLSRSRRLRAYSGSRRITLCFPVRSSRKTEVDTDTAVKETR